MKSVNEFRFRRLQIPAILVLALSGCQATAAQNAPAGVKSTPPNVVVKQDPGKIVYWVMPGPRRLSKEIFGTPANPKMLVAPKIEAAKKMVAAKKMPPSVPGLLRDLPVLVGVPLKARKLDKDGNWWINAPTPFSDKARIVQGSFMSRYWDVVDLDPPGPPGKTPDKAEFEAKFTDPAGNNYRVVLDHVVKPPFPGYETRGGVLLKHYFHGTSGTGTPLMPQTWGIAALWGVANVYINGKMVEANRVIHVMTTTTMRDKDYHLALQSEVPLPPARWQIKGHDRETHLIVLPIAVVKGKGPVFKPLQTAFILPNGKPQPFMHINWEQDEIVR